MFKMKETANGKTGYENAREAAKQAGSLSGKIPTLKKIEVCVNSKEAPMDNFELVLICDFDDMNGLDEYQNHPDHKAFGAFLKNIRDGRACIDFEIK